jgi:hypothetical protein
MEADQLDIARPGRDAPRWSAAFDERIAGLDLSAKLEASRPPYCELDTDGRIITHSSVRDVT